MKADGKKKYRKEKYRRKENYNNREPEEKSKESRKQEGNKGNRNRNDSEQQEEEYEGRKANRKLSLIATTVNLFPFNTSDISHQRKGTEGVDREHEKMKNEKREG